MYTTLCTWHRAPRVRLGERAWELADFIVKGGLGVTSWPGRYEATIAFQRACHTRGTRSAAPSETLLASIDRVTLEQQCCGFGGVFSVGFPSVSSAMGALKLDFIRKSQADAVASGYGLPRAPVGPGRRRRATAHHDACRADSPDALRKAGLLP